jgi:hypothetical protein
LGGKPASSVSGAAFGLGFRHGVQGSGGRPPIGAVKKNPPGEAELSDGANFRFPPFRFWPFLELGLSPLDLPASVVRIGEFAFSRCGLAQVELGGLNGVLRIARCAFSGCQALASLVVRETFSGIN